MIKLFGEELGLLQGPDVCHTCRWVHSTTCSCIHHVDVVTRSSFNNLVKTVLALKQVDEMEIWSTERLTYISSADQRLEQHQPDCVDVTTRAGRALPTLRNIGTLLLRYPDEDGTQQAASFSQSSWSACSSILDGLLSRDVPLLPASLRDDVGSFA